MAKIRRADFHVSRWRKIKRTSVLTTKPEFNNYHSKDIQSYLQRMRFRKQLHWDRQHE